MLRGGFVYKLINIISVLIRQFLLPNPYISWFDNELSADLFNIIVGGFILHKLSFWLTGIGYTKGIDEPAGGSLGYLVSYIILTVIITLIGNFIVNIKAAIVVFLVIYVLLCIVVNKIFNRYNNF